MEVKLYQQNHMKITLKHVTFPNSGGKGSLLRMGYQFVILFGNISSLCIKFENLFLMLAAQLFKVHWKDLQTIYP